MKAILNRAIQDELTDDDTEWRAVKTFKQSDHQIIAPVYVMSFTKVGQPGMNRGEEGIGYGWRTEALIEARDIVPPIKCQMERPPK